MNYEEFKASVVTGLHDYYGAEVCITVSPVLKDNGKREDGIFIRSVEKPEELVPVVYLNRMYECYEKGSVSMDACVQQIIDTRHWNKDYEKMKQFSNRIRDWGQVKAAVYPILLPTEENEELLENLVTGSFLDLSVAYIIREKSENSGNCSIKINRGLLEVYGISQEQLHEQAMQNLEQDSYGFYNIVQCIANYMEWGKPIVMGTEVKVLQTGSMYVLVNMSEIYGAAGILNRRLLHEKIHGMNCYILPSSIHETVFVPVEPGIQQWQMDDMVQEVNESMAGNREKLSNHSYFYDAQTEEIRIWE